MAAAKVTGGERLNGTGNGHSALPTPVPAAAPIGETEHELRHTIASARVDAEYALRQLVRFRDVQRAIDGLERVVELLKGE